MKAVEALDYIKLSDRDRQMALALAIALGDVDPKTFIRGFEAGALYAAAKIKEKITEGGEE